MKANYLIVFIFFVMTLVGSLTAIPAFAQDENDPSVNEFKDLNPNTEVNLNEDKSLASDHDRSSKVSDSIRTHTSALSSQKIKSGDRSKPSSTKEEDALTFNFLYYIIQKFKISDLVDD
jgi:hypothetical protein